LKVKEPLESVLVRVPEWVSVNSSEVFTQTNGRSRQLRWEGRYLNLGSARSGELIAASFPIPQRTTKETIGNILYTLDIKGNTVVNIDPPGENVPLYQRRHYLARQAPLRKLERFVPTEAIAW